MNPRKCSKPIFPIFDQHFNCVDSAVAENRTAASGEVGPFHSAWLGRGPRREIAQHLISLTYLEMDASSEQFFDLAGVAELSKGYAFHGLNVTQNVTHCQ